MAAINIAMWSGPRNLSTAMMRAFENRPDTTVWDEPFYAAYLWHTGLDHPMRDAVMAAGETDWRRVAARCASAPADGGVCYQKHMTHHMLRDFGTDWMVALEHGFLLRHPARVLRSYVAKREQVALADIGVVQQWELFCAVRDRLGTAPLVVDSDDFLIEPRAYLERMCTRWGLAFSERMLSWPSGARASDGAWAPHWYGSVWQTTGFGAPRPPVDERLPDALQRVCDEAMPYYDKLAREKLTV
ncbi:MAG: HAD family hydrolase [Pseudomonadota bacterium]